MKRRRRIALLAGAGVVGLLAVVPARAAEPDRPNEDEMFGSAPAAPAKPAADAKPAEGGAGGAAPSTGTAVSTEPSSATPPPVGSPGAPVQPVAPPDTDRGTARDVNLLGDPNAEPKLSQDVAPDDPLKIGGQIYLRAAYNHPGSANFANLFNGTGPAQYTTFSAPSLLDAYFDARPNDRVRGFVLGRLFFDPTLPSVAAPVTAGTSSSTMTGTTTDSGSTMNLQNVNLASLGISGVSNTRGPSAVLDQMWLRFDIAHTVFVTVGRQHVRWGTGRFWSPTDFLHPVHRNPVAVFDARPGFTMLKLHLPWEERGWNFYAFGLFEGVPRWDRDSMSYPVGGDVVSTLGQIGGAARAEFVLGPAELGLDAVVYDNQKARYGADLSFGVGDFDFYGDAAFRYGSEIPRVPNYVTDPSDPMIYYSVGIKPQVVGGLTYSLKYNDNDVFTLAGEYFYNGVGYSDPHAYVNLFTTGLFEFFYTGRHYAAFSAILNAPWSWNYSNFSFTQIGNMSDQSFISRLDYSYTLLTHMTFEAFGAMNYGHREGEFRLGFDNVPINGTPRTLLPQSFSLGLGLRVKI